MLFDQVLADRLERAPPAGGVVVGMNSFSIGHRSFLQR
jgi:hypothetical protein